MPRPGDGSSHNGPFEEAGHDVAHGVGAVDVRVPEIDSLSSCEANGMQTDKVARADKTAPMPEGLQEKGAGLEGKNASGGQSQGIKKGDGVGQGGATN